MLAFLSLILLRLYQALRLFEIAFLVVNKARYCKFILATLLTAKVKPD